MLVRLEAFDMSTVVSAVHPKNALVPMLETLDFPKSIVFRPVQLLNAAFGTL